MLEACGLTCSKRDRTLFEGLSLVVNTGELLYLRGPNGAGKTSLLRILTGLSAPDSGAVLYNGVNISEDKTGYYRDLFYLGHKSGTNGSLSALDNLSFWLAQHSISMQENTLYDVCLLYTSDAADDPNTVYRCKKIRCMTSWQK